MLNAHPRLSDAHARIASLACQCMSATCRILLNVVLYVFCSPSCTSSPARGTCSARTLTQFDAYPGVVIPDDAFDGRGG